MEMENVSITSEPSGLDIEPVKLSIKTENLDDNLVKSPSSATCLSPMRANYEDATRRKQVRDLTGEVRLLRNKLNRRNVLMEELIKAYHQDIVTVKIELLRQEELAAKKDDSYQMSTEVKDYVPSVDLRDFLQLYAPSETYIHLTPCHTCGGTLEILHFDSKKTESLISKCAEMEQKVKESEQLLTCYRAEALRDQKTLVDERLRIDLEREVYERRIFDLKCELAKIDPKVFNDMRHEVNVLRIQNKELNQRKNEQQDQNEKAKEEMEALTRKLERNKVVSEDLAESLRKKCEQLQGAYQMGVARCDEAHKEITNLQNEMDELKTNNIKLGISLATARRVEEASRQKVAEAEKKNIITLSKTASLEKTLLDTTKKLEITRAELDVLRLRLSKFPGGCLVTPPLTPSHASQQQQHPTPIFQLPEKLSAPVPSTIATSSPAQIPQQNVMTQLFMDAVAIPVDLPSTSSIGTQTVDADPSLLPPSAKALSVDETQMRQEVQRQPVVKESASLTSTMIANEDVEPLPPQPSPSPPIVVDKKAEEIVPLEQSEHLSAPPGQSKASDGDDNASSSLQEQEKADVPLVIAEEGRVPSAISQDPTTLNDIVQIINNQETSTPASDQQQPNLIDLQEEQHPLVPPTLSQPEEATDAPELNVCSSPQESIITPTPTIVEDVASREEEQQQQRSMESLESVDTMDAETIDASALLQGETNEMSKGTSADDAASPEEVPVPMEDAGDNVASQQSAPSEDLESAAGATIEEQEGKQVTETTTNSVISLYVQPVPQQEGDDGQNDAPKNDVVGKQVPVPDPEAAKLLQTPSSALEKDKSQSEHSEAPTLPIVMPAVSSLSPSNDPDNEEGGKMLDIVKGMLDRQRTDARRKSISLNEEVQKTSEENRVLVETLLVANQERELAQAALAKVQTQLERVQRDYELKHGMIMASMVDESIVQELRENFQELELSSLETKLHLEDRIRDLDQEVIELRMSLDEEQSRGRGMQIAFDTLTSEKKKTEERLAKEETRAENLREELREDMHKVADLLREKSELTTDFNSQLKSKNEEIATKDAALAVERQQLKDSQQMLAPFLTEISRVCKGIEESLEKRVSSTKLNGIEDIVRNVAVKRLARRFDKKDPISIEEMMLQLDGEPLGMPLTYLQTRLAWSYDNMMEETTAGRLLRKDLIKQVRDAANKETRLEKKVADLTQKLQEEKSTNKTTLASKNAEMNQLQKAINRLETEMNMMSQEIDRLLAFEALYNDLKASQDVVHDHNGDLQERINEVLDQCASMNRNMEQALADKAGAEKDRADALHQRDVMETELVDSKQDLCKTMRGLEEANAVIKGEEMRRALSKSVPVQSDPNVVDVGIQTAFLLPDLNLRHSIGVKGATSNKVFVERIVTPAIAQQYARRCSTTMCSGDVIVSTISTAEDEKYYHHQNRFSPEHSNNKPLSQPTAAGILFAQQSIGSMRKEVADILKPFHEGKWTVATSPSRQVVPADVFVSSHSSPGRQEKPQTSAMMMMRGTSSLQKRRTAPYA